MLKDVKTDIQLISVNIWSISWLILYLAGLNILYILFDKLRFQLSFSIAI